MVAPGDDLLDAASGNGEAKPPRGSAPPLTSDVEIRTSQDRELASRVALRQVHRREVTMVGPTSGRGTRRRRCRRDGGSRRIGVGRAQADAIRRIDGGGVEPGSASAAVAGDPERVEEGRLQGRPRVRRFHSG